MINAEYNSPDHENKIGGRHGYAVLGSSDVDSVFVPGMIKGSDFSDTDYYQYIKTFIYNKHISDSSYNTKIYGYNTKRNNIVKFALEKGPDSGPIINGDETVKNRTVAPSLYGSYDFTELHSDGAVSCGNSGTLVARSAQGVWLRMECNRSDTEDALDSFYIGVKSRSEEL